MSLHGPLTLKLSLREKFTYGVGDFGSNLILCIGTLYLLKSYTDELGMPAYYGRIISLVAKFFTTFTDMLTGVLSDLRRNIGAKGKFEPFILYASFPVAAIASAQFLAIDFTLAVETGLAIILFMLPGLLYSPVNCPYGTAVSATTKNLHERAQLAAWRQGGAIIGLLLCTVDFMSIQALFVNSSSLGYLVAALIFSVYGLFNMQWCFGGVKERYIEIVPGRHKPNILKSFCTVSRNPPPLVLCVTNLCTLAAFNIGLTIQVYYTQYVLNDIHLLSWMGLSSVECALAGVLPVPAVVRRFGKKQVYLGGLALWAIDDVLNFFWDSASFLFVAFFCMAFFGTAFVNSLNWALVPDTANYGKWKTGIHAEGSIYTGYISSREISATFVGFLSGIILAQAGYIPNIIQSNTILFGLRQLIFLWPCGLAIIAAFTMGLFYKLSETRFAFTVEEINQRRRNDTLSSPITIKNNIPIVNI